MAPAPGARGAAGLTGPPDPPGSQREPWPTFGRYRVLGELGRGGMAVVYRALQAAPRREVALKVLGGLARFDLAARARFAREVEALGRLAHPGIVTVLEAGEERGVPFLVLELVEGGSLEDRVRRAGPLSPMQAAGLVAEVARAVHFAHERGVVHRDLKASNILLGPEGRPKVTDFGLASLRAAPGRLTETGELAGTPHAMAPEQVAGQPVDARTDVYALGVLLHRVVAGAPPFAGLAPPQLWRAILEDPPPSLGEGARRATPPGRSAPEVPAALDEVARRALQKAPAARFPTALALAEALERVAAPAPGRRPRRRPGARAGPRGLALGALAAVGLAAAGVAAAVAARRPPGTPPAAVGSAAAPPPSAPAPAPAPPAPPRLDDAAHAALAAEVGRALDEVRPDDALARLAAVPPEHQGDPRVVVLTGTAHLLRGQRLRSRGDPAGARPAFEEALARLEPLALDDARARFLRGLALGELGRWEEAVAVHRGMLLQDPTRADAAEFVGWALAAAEGRCPEVTRRFADQRPLPDDEARRRLADAAELLALLARGRRPVPDRGAVLLRLARALDLRDDPAGAGPPLDRAVAEDPGGAGPLLARGEWHLAHGRVGPADQDLAAAMERAPPDGEAETRRATRLRTVVRGLRLFEAGDVDGGLALLEQVAALEARDDAAAPDRDPSLGHFAGALAEAVRQRR